MAVAFHFKPNEFSIDTYDEAIRKLEEAGSGFGNVPGRIFHCAMDVDGQVEVFDVWESQEQFETFGETLMPITGSLGADPGQPRVLTIHNLQNG
jgi:hypothetical protein